MVPVHEQSGQYVFLSYSSDDRERALQIADLLEANGVPTWVDRRSIIGGTSWSQEIVRGVEHCAVVFLLCSATSMVSRNVQQEIQLAWETNRPIIPLMLEPVAIAESIRYTVVGRQWLELFGRTDDDWIVDALQTLVRLNVTPTPATTSTSPNDAVSRALCPTCHEPVAQGQRFCANCGTALAAGSPAATTESERRSLSIIVIDFLPANDGDEPLDPEDFAGPVRAAWQRSLEILRRYEGTPLPGAAGRLAAYFGVPSIREDDALRSARAALEIVAAVEQLPSPHVRASAAIHTGLVIIGRGTADDFAVTGDLHGVVTSMLEFGEPGTVVTSTATHRLIQGYFRVSDLGPQRVHGQVRPLQMFQIIEENDARSRLEVAASRGLTPLVGRQSELSLLLERWERTRERAGQVVLLIGEPGIGKSRLSFDLREAVGANPATWVIPLQCAEIHQQTPFYPVIELFERQLLNFSPRMTIEDRRAAIQAYVAATDVTTPDAIHLLSSLLSIPPDPETTAPVIAPDRLRQLTIEWLVSLVLSRAEQQPVLVQCEDLQWSDPSTLELLAMLVDYCPSAAVMVVVTSRPGLMTNWLNRSHVTTLNLARLSTGQSNDFIQRATGGRSLAPRVVEQIVSKADGVPLFLEELTRSVIESDNVREVDGHFESVGDASTIGIPATLYDLLHARLDQLGEVREVAQIGATIGREFSFEILNAVSTWGETSLRHALARLIDAKLIQQRGLPSQTTYFFRHSLLRDAAYGSLVRGRRQLFHRRTATALVEQFPDIAANRPELVAHHYTEAGEVGPAIQWWFNAGQRAVRTSANLEAIAHLARGLALLEPLPETVARMQAEMGMQMTLGVALMTTQGFAAREVQTAFQRAYDLCQVFGDVPEVIPALHGLWTFYIVRAEIDTAHQIAEQLLRLSEQAGNDGILVQSLLSLGTTEFFMGELEAARSHLERAVTIYDSGRHAANAYIYGHEPGTASMSYLALSVCLLGYPDQALARSRSGVELGRLVNHPLSFARSLTEAAQLRSLMRDPEGTQAFAQDAIAFSTEHGVVLWTAVATAVAGWASAAGGDPATGIDLMRQGAEGYQATGAMLGTTYLLMCLAEAHEWAGNGNEASSVIERALDLVQATGERYVLAELLRLKAELLLNDGQVEAGEHCLRDALDTARAQHARGFELRIVTDFARLLHARGQSSAGRELLEPVIDAICEGHDLSDYRHAREVLDHITG